MPAPGSYVRTNIHGTLNVLQAARELGVERMLHTSTSEVYGTARCVPIDEQHALQGQSPYSASKIGADKLAEAFHCSFGVPVVTVRPFNTFGPRQSARAVIPTIIAQCLAGKRTIRLGNLAPTRDMNYVSNTVDGFLAAATAGGGGRADDQSRLRSRDQHRRSGPPDRTTGRRGSRVETREERLRPEQSEVHAARVPTIHWPAACLAGSRRCTRGRVAAHDRLDAKTPDEIPA